MAIVPIKIRRALAATPVAVPLPGADGELAFAQGGFTNAPAHTTGNDLIISQGGTNRTLISPTRQVEIEGAQTIVGRKTFPLTAISITGGAVTNLLSTDGAGDLSWVPAPAGGGFDEATADLLYVRKIGDAMAATGLITAVAPPTADGHLTNKLYVDTAIAGITGGLLLVGTYDVAANVVTSSNPGMPAGPLAPAAAALLGYYVIITTGGTGTGNAPPVVMDVGDWIVCDGTAWKHITIKQMPVAVDGTSILGNGIDLPLEVGTIDGGTY